MSRRHQDRLALTLRDVDRAIGKRNGTAAQLVSRGHLHAVPFFGELRVPLEEVQRFVASGITPEGRRPRARPVRDNGRDTDPHRPGEPVMTRIPRRPDLVAVSGRTLDAFGLHTATHYSLGGSIVCEHGELRVEPDGSLFLRPSPLPWTRPSAAALPHLPVRR